MYKLSWNPPKWKSYTLNAGHFQVELETGKVYQGILNNNFINMNPDHSNNCRQIFGQSLTRSHEKEINELSRVLDLNLKGGNWPEYPDVEEFLKRYYERVANSNKSKIYIETEFNITPKFTL